MRDRHNKLALSILCLTHTQRVCSKLSGPQPVQLVKWDEIDVYQTLHMYCSQLELEFTTKLSCQNRRSLLSELLRSLANQHIMVPQFGYRNLVPKFN